MDYRYCIANEKERYEEKQEKLLNEPAIDCQKVAYLKSSRSYSMDLRPAERLSKRYTLTTRVYAWDQDQASRCFVHIVNSSEYGSITGSPPYRPILAADYEAADFWRTTIAIVLQRRAQSC